jgi:hypothetical protein
MHNDRGGTMRNNVRAAAWTAFWLLVMLAAVVLLTGYGHWFGGQVNG